MIHVLYKEPIFLLCIKREHINAFIAETIIIQKQNCRQSIVLKRENS